MVIAPLSRRLGPDLQCHENPLSGIVPAAPQYEGVGETSQVGYPHLDIGLEAAGGQDYPPSGVDIKVFLQGLSPAPDYITLGVHNETLR
ncbi:hypothetical protein ES703_73855 [subsurface metagenome]